MSSSFDLFAWLFIASLAAMWGVLAVWLLRTRSSRAIKIGAASATALMTGMLWLVFVRSVHEAKDEHERVRAMQTSVQAQLIQLNAQQRAHVAQGK